MENRLKEYFDREEINTPDSEVPESVMLKTKQLLPKIKEYLGDDINSMQDIMKKLDIDKEKGTLLLLTFIAIALNSEKIIIKKTEENI